MRCLVALLLFCTVAAAGDVSLVRVDLIGPQDGLKLQRLGLDIMAITPNGKAQVVAQEEDLKVLKKSGLTHKVLIPDLEWYYEQRLLSDPAFKNRAWPNGSMGGYYTNSEIEAELDAWALKYPNLITPKTSIGKTIQGRDIWAVKISDNPNQDENEPEVCYDTLMHPREMMGVMTTLYYMKALLEGYGTDPELTHLVDNREIWFIPVHNPDGHVYNQQTHPNGGGMWRKNRRHNGGGIYGVDLARNYGYKWGYDNIGSSPNPNSIAYRGTGPFSEPESQAVRDFLTTRPIVTGWNTHTYTNVYICPFCYDTVLPYGPDWPLYQEYLRDISIENGYPGGPSPDTLGYFANGTPLDWQYADQNIFCLAPEIGTWEDGFWPPKSRIVPLAEENLLACKYWSWIAGGYVRLKEHGLIDHNKDGLFHPGEPIDVTLILRNKGLGDTKTNVGVKISSPSPYVMFIKDTHQFPMMPSVTNADNSSNPLKIKLMNNTPYGAVIKLHADITFDSHTLRETLIFECGIPRILASLDMEQDPGWTKGAPGDTATTGIWELGNPRGTMFGTLPVQPEDDHTPGPGVKCFVTGNGSVDPDGDDVDHGKTTLITSLFDLAGEDQAIISYWRWYADLGAFFSNNDIFQVDISNNNGASWVNVELLDHTENYWKNYAFLVSDLITPTHQMKMRFIAEDEPDDSLCEACIDDMVIKTYTQPVSLSLIGTPKIGTTVHLPIVSPDDSGLDYAVVASLGTYPPIVLTEQIFPLRYDFFLAYSLKPNNGMFYNFYGKLDSSGQSFAPAFVIPNLYGMVGVEIFFAALTLDPAYADGVKHISAPLSVIVVN